MESFKLDEGELQKINLLTRREFTADELYAFPTVLCDNEIDRDGERFSKESLIKLSELFVGKTGIFDHNPKGENQTARIYDTEVLTDRTRTTKSGEPYSCLLGYVYMVRTDKNRDLIKEIEGGIKKEVSVSCAVKRKVCSICGKDKLHSDCRHKAGKTYQGKLCSVILKEPYDAYEFSFVAVPAQPKAGVTKTFADQGGGLEPAESREELLVRAVTAASQRILSADGELLKSFLSRLQKNELLEAKALLSKLEYTRLPKRSYKYLDEIGQKTDNNTTLDIYKL